MATAFALVAAWTIIGAHSMQAQAEQERSEGEPILVYERSYRLTDHPHVMVWAPDSQRIAFKEFNRGRLTVLDTDEQGGTARPIADKIFGASVAWSPAGDTIAVSQSSHFSGIRLLSAHDGRELARREHGRDVPHERCDTRRGSVAFSVDGHSLWVTCRVIRAPGSLTLALRRDSADLSLRDELRIDAPVSDQFTTNSHSAISWHGERPHLSALLASQIPKDKFSFSVTGMYGYVIDLESKTELLARFTLSDDNRSGYFRRPDELILFPGANFALARLNSGISTRPDVPVEPKFDRLFDGYDTRTGERIVSYGGETDDTPENGVIGGVAIIPGSDVMIGRWARASARHGGLIVLEWKTGLVRQRIIGARVGRIALSPNGERLAVVTYETELRLYRVGPAGRSR
jgi:dipeptidyl aminopeptidase/acylaminoacyl peptidase